MMVVELYSILDRQGACTRVCLRTILPVLVGLCLIWSAPVQAQKVQESVESLKKIDVEEHLGDTLPLDLHFTNEAGENVTLGQYFSDGKPVILILGYYECPRLCNLVFNGVSEVITKINWTIGDQYRIVTVSINPDETPELAAAKKKNYWQTLGTDADPAAWTFLIGQQDQITMLADAVGFQYYADPNRDGEYAHPAVIMIAGPSGLLSRYLYGISFKPNDIKFSLMDAADGKVGTPVEKLLLYCFHYDPQEGSYVVFANNVMKLGGVAMLLFVIIFLGIYWLRERRHRHLPAGTKRYEVKEADRTR